MVQWPVIASGNCRLRRRNGDAAIPRIRVLFVSHHGLGKVKLISPPFWNQKISKMFYLQCNEHRGCWRNVRADTDRETLVVTRQCERSVMECAWMTDRARTHASSSLAGGDSYVLSLGHRCLSTRRRALPTSASGVRHAGELSRRNEMHGARDGIEREFARILG